MVALSVAALALAFLITLFAGTPMIRWLQKKQLKEQVRDVGPASHQQKRGTPTMGGLVMIVVIVVLSLILDRHWQELLPLLVAVLGFGLLGAADDLSKISNREGYGFQVRYKFVWHPALAVALALMLFLLGREHAIDAGPIRQIDIGWWYVALAALAIFSSSSSSLIDGLDGLAAGVYALCFLAYFIIALHNQQPTLAVFTTLVIGTLLGFLWFNVNPAQVFMGDTGALALGGTLGVVAMMSHQVLLLPLIGLLLVVDVASVMLQVAYFKLTRGKRLFRMSPFHHHLELLGWPEVKVVQRFWIVTAVTSAVGVGLVFL